MCKNFANRNPKVKSKDNFKEKHPNYRNFFVDPEPPLKVPPQKDSKLNWKKLLSDYEKEKVHPRHRNKYPYKPYRTSKSSRYCFSIIT